MRTPEHERAATAEHARTEALKDAPVIQAAALRALIRDADDRNIRLAHEARVAEEAIQRVRELCNIADGYRTFAGIVSTTDVRRALNNTGETPWES